MNNKNISFNERRQLEDVTVPYATVLLSKMGFRDVTDTLDTNLDFNAATDFVAILDGKSVSIAYRCRNRNSFQYKDFGLRASTRNGQPSELEKIKKGLVDYYLYVYLRQDNSFCYNYFLLDLQWANNKKGRKERRVGVFNSPINVRQIKDAKMADFSWDQIKRYMVVNSFIL